FKARVLPELEAFRPDLILISAGFDAHAADPLANLRLQEPDFAWATGELMAIAARTSNGRVVSMLEGGYDLEALGKSVGVHVETLMGA
ncbi:MAG: histone deacetylase family protein, partial [Pseudomonadota bacterium]